MSNRIKATLIHSMISSIILAILLGWIFFIWYPDSLVKAMGLIHIIVLTILIHFLIAPLLTLFIYRSGKKTLLFDLSIIGLMQIIALGYAIWVIAQGKPAWIVYDVGNFEIVRPIDIEQRDNAVKNFNKYQQISWFKPQYVAIQFNKSDNQEFTNDVLAMMFGASRALEIERYVSVDNAKDQMQKTSQKLKVLSQYNDPQLVQKTLAKYPQATAFLPLKANAVDMTVLINKEKGEVVKIVDLRPWK